MSVGGERAKRASTSLRRKLRASEASEHVIAKEIASERTRHCEGNFSFGIYCGQASEAGKRAKRASERSGQASEHVIVLVRHLLAIYLCDIVCDNAEVFRHISALVCSDPYSL